MVLRVLDEPEARLNQEKDAPRLDVVPSVTELFHRVNRLLPAEQQIVTVGPQTTAREALRLMKKHGYSQVPVVEGTDVLGVFSYRSFSLNTIARCP